MFISPEMIQQLASQEVKTILLQFTDISGHVKGISVPLNQVSTQHHAICIDGSSLESQVRQREKDMTLIPDIATLRILPQQGDNDKIAALYCTVATAHGKLFDGDPRAVLQRTIENAKAMGLAYETSAEVEFFICSLDATGQIAPLAGDHAGYFDGSADTGSHIRHAIVRALCEMKIQVDSSHHEVAPGQHEIDLAIAPAMVTADAILTLKFIAKSIAERYGATITFMPKPFNDMSGSGMHIHQRLASTTTGMQVISDGPRSLTPLALQFIAGQLHHAAAATAVTSPLMNSYKRLASGFEAPSTICWAHENRSAYIRIPTPVDRNPALSSIEVRGCDPSCNPYLAFTVLLQAGLDGIRNSLEAPAPMEEYIYPFEQQDRIPMGSTFLPLTLGEALQALSSDLILQESLGEHAFSRFVEMKRREWRAYQTRVTEWEQRSLWDIA